MGNYITFPRKSPMNVEHMLTEEEKEKIQRLASEGYPVLRIAKELGRDPKTVRKYMRRNREMDIDDARSRKIVALPQNQEDAGKLALK